MRNICDSSSTSRDQVVQRAAPMRRSRPNGFSITTRVHDAPCGGAISPARAAAAGSVSNSVGGVAR